MEEEIRGSDAASRLDLLAEALRRWQGPSVPLPSPPRVTVADSIRGDHLVCLETGRRVVLLRRHLARLGIRWEEYRRKWRLPADYPTVAPAYAEARAQARSRSVILRHTPKGRVEIT